MLKPGDKVVRLYRISRRAKEINKWRIISERDKIQNVG